MKVSNMIVCGAIFALYFLAKCEAGEFCGYYDEYCEHGCCEGGCCDADISVVTLVLGLVFGLGGTIIVIIVIICICQRRRTRGVVYRQQMPANGIIVTTSQQQGVVTSNMPAGVVHGGVQYPAPQYGAYPQPQPMPQYTPQPMSPPMAQPYQYPQTQAAYAQGPPSYHSVIQKPE